jgi:chorismate lyase / 3-hydroxybenzoate synthase
MSVTAANGLSIARRRRRAADAPHWPNWVGDFISGGSPSPLTDAAEPGLNIAVWESHHWRLMRVRIEAATHLAAKDFCTAVMSAYAAIARRLAGDPIRHLVRLWNYLPDIHRAYGPDLDRYMAFNSGRFEAFRRWFGSRSQWMRRVPTASGVGHAGTDLVIDALAADTEGTPIQNPRQVPPCDYSRRYGPLPPCFARATLIPAGGGRRPLLLLGGTASVIGEESMHEGNLPAQFRETLANLSSLMGAAGLAAPRLADLRVYHPRRGDAADIKRWARDKFPAATCVEVVEAQLCRRELFIEIEGLVVDEGTTPIP